MPSLLFSVPGVPVPQGSMRFVVSRTTGRPIPKNNQRLDTWRADLRAAAQAAMRSDQLDLASEPVAVSLCAVLARPKAHYGTGRNTDVLKPSAPSSPSNANSGDADKLARAALDAMTGIVYHDDSQVCALLVSKRYALVGEPSGMDVGVVWPKDGNCRSLEVRWH